ncbi:MAG: mechanosensitive ion channel family protein [Gammaproteobacteria bacterium]|nr:mechanosensitive ion channel family protein [Gammaproteobacteria bacterium]
MENLLLPDIDLLAKESLWYIQIFIVVFATLVINFFQKRILNRLHQRFQTTDLVWDDALIDAIRRPVSILIWLIGISFAAYIIGLKTGAPIFEAVSPIRDIGIITLLSWFLLRLVNNVQSNVVVKGEAKGKPVDITTADAVSKLIRVSIVITSVLVTLQTLGFSVSGVLAFGGIGGIAVGFAAKDLLANFFGGLMIYLDRPFEVGDWVRSPDRDIEGYVEHIGWRLTRIRTFEKRPLYIPNATFANIAVENPSRMTHRRIYETIGVRYNDAEKVREIIENVKAMLIEHPEIDNEQTLIVNFNKFAPSSLDFFIYTFTRITNWSHYHEIKQDVLLKVEEIIRQHNAEIAFPTSTIHLKDPQREAHEASKT